MKLHVSQSQYMKPSNIVQGHPASFDAYTRHGWKLIPIPPGTKGPVTKGWNRKENVVTDHTQIPHGCGIGLAHAYSGTMALDIDDWDRAHQELLKFGVDLTQLYQAPDAVIIDSGRQGHGKLLYAMPFGAALPSKKLIDQHPDGTKYNYLDFRCGTSNGLTAQDVLPPSIHPVTGTAYRWAGHGKWENLPTIPQPLLDMWTDMVERDKQLSIPTNTKINASWQEIEDALEFIDPSLSRDEWVQVGMALHWAGHHTDNADHALYLWNEWSKGSEKYKGPRDVFTQWKSFTNRDDGVKLGTFFTIAQQYGYKRPIPDVSQLFGSIDQLESLPEHKIPDPSNLIKGLRPTVPDLDLSLIPEKLRVYAEELSVQMGADPLVSVFAGLGVVSGTMDAHSRVVLANGFEQPPILWLMTIGSPSERKSPASKPLFKPLEALENEDIPNFRRKHIMWEAKEAAYNAAKNAFLDHAKNPESALENDAAAEPPGELAPEPSPLRIKVSDITSQKLIRLASSNPDGLICHLDEMNGWIRQITDRNSIENRSTWIHGYEVGKVTMDRVGSGSIEAKNFAVSIYGNVQPKVYWDNVQAMEQDGLLQRFCPAILRNWDVVPMPSASLEKSTATKDWDILVRTIHSLPPMKYPLSPEAYNVFRGFQHWYQTRKKQERILNANDRYMTAYGKLEGLAGRLMLVFQLIEDPFSHEISENIASRVIDFIRTYTIPALRFLLNGAADQDESFEEWLINHVVQLSGEVETVTLRDLKRSSRNRIKSLTKKGMYSNYEVDAAVRDGMYMLEQCGYVILVNEDQRRNHYVWSVNPHIATMFEEYRKQRIIARQRIYDDCYKKLTESGRTKKAEHNQALGFKEEWREEMGDE